MKLRMNAVLAGAILLAAAGTLTLAQRGSSAQKPASAAGPFR